MPVKRERSNFVRMRKLLLTILLWQIRSQRSSAFCREPHTLLLESLSNGNRLLQYRAIQDANEEFNSEGPEDTVRVRIWRTLVEENGRELSLTVLSSILGDRRSDVRHHLTHVEKQCKSLQSKSEAWRLRRGLPEMNFTSSFTDFLSLLLCGCVQEHKSAVASYCVITTGNMHSESLL